MILMIDNYDSFTYNLVQYLLMLGAKVEVVRNDRISLDEIQRKNPAGQEPFRVGVLFSESGVTSVIERSELTGTRLAVEEINDAGGIHGRVLQIKRYDPESTPARFQQMAEKLLVEDGVRVILGCYMSSTRKAVIPVVEKYNGLLMYPTLYEGFEYSRNVIYTGAAPNQNSVQLAE